MSTIDPLKKGATLEQLRRVQEYEDGKIDELKGDAGNNIKTDSTLTVSGKAADAKAVGDALKSISAGVVVGRFFGKVANFLGDSQTDDAGNYKSVFFYDWLKDILGLSATNNYGYSGTTIMPIEGQTRSFLERYASMSDDADLIVVWGGTNDYHYGHALGEVDDTANTTFCGALNNLCKGLIAKYPQKDILFVTPTPRGNITSAVATQEEYADAIIDVCAKYCIPVFDAFRKCNMPIIVDSDRKYTADGLHLNDLGHEILGKSMANFILYGPMAGCQSAFGTGSDTVVAVNGVTLSNQSATIEVGGTIQLTATVEPSNASDKSVVWSTSNESVATVNDGLVKGIADGTAIITVKTVSGNKTATCTVTVDDGQGEETTTGITIINNSVQSANYTNETLTLGSLNQTYGGIMLNDVTKMTINADSNSFDTDNGFGWFCVRDGSVYHAIGMDHSFMTEQYDFDSSLVTPVAVTIPSVKYPTSGTIELIVEGTNANLYFNGKLVHSVNGDAIGYMASNIKPLSLYGLTVSTDDFSGDSSNVKVSGVLLNKTALTITAGGNAEQLTVTIFPDNATNQNVIWSASNGNCTVVNGLVTAVASGDCTITATTEDGGYAASCVVKVSEPAAVAPTSPVDGKTITFTSACVHTTNMSNIMCLVSADDLANKSGAVVIEAKIANATQTITGGRGMACYQDESGEVGNNAFKTPIVASYVQTTVDGDTITATSTYNPDRLSYPYVKFPLSFTPGAYPVSFDIVSLTLSIGGEYVPIQKVGAFTANEGYSESE